MRKILGLAMALGLAATTTTPIQAEAASLRGSAASMAEQNRVARDHGLSFYRTADEIRAAAARGELVELSGNDNYEVADFVRYPYLQPELLLFVERLSAQYRDACGQKLVVTSAVRPTSGQPSNAHRLSVHPAGMAIDLRVSDRAQCRNWLEAALLGLERRGVLNAIREFHPPHYHVAVYPQQYLAYAEERMAVEAELARSEAVEETPAAEAPEAALAAAPGVASFARVADRPAGTANTPRGIFAATLAMAVALPVGLGLLVRRRRKR